MKHLNVTIIEGNLTKNAELSYFDNQSAYCNFSVANNDGYMDQQGNWVDMVSYFDCQIKGKYAEAMAKHLVKGRAVKVVGKLKQQRWEKDGQKFSRIIIRVDSLFFGAKKTTDEQERPQQGFQPLQQGQYQQQQTFQERTPAYDSGFDSEPSFDIPEDIPF